jgi:hypothetical protein
MRRSIAFLLLFPLLAFAGENEQPLPDVKLLAAKVIARVKDTDKRNVWGSFRYKAEFTEVQFDSDGKEKQRDVRMREYEPVDGRPFGRVVSHNGGPPDKDDLEKQEKKLAEHKKRQAERAAGKRNAEDRELNEEIMSRFDYVLVHRELVNGRPAFLISLKPKPGPKPEPSAADKVVNRLAGRVWIDEADNEVVRADVYLTEPVSVYLGIGNVRALRVQYHAQKVEPDVWMPETLELDIEGRKLFSNFRQKTTQRYFGFQRISGTSAAGLP